MSNMGNTNAAERASSSCSSAGSDVSDYVVIERVVPAPPQDVQQIEQQQETRVVYLTIDDSDDDIDKKQKKIRAIMRNSNLTNVEKQQKIKEIQMGSAAKRMADSDNESEKSEIGYNDIPEIGYTFNNGTEANEHCKRVIVDGEGNSYQRKGKGAKFVVYKCRIDDCVGYYKFQVERINQKFRSSHKYTFVEYKSCTCKTEKVKADQKNVVFKLGTVFVERHLFTKALKHQRESQNYAFPKKEKDTGKKQRTTWINTQIIKTTDKCYGYTGKTVRYECEGKGCNGCIEVKGEKKQKHELGITYKNFKITELVQCDKYCDSYEIYERKQCILCKLSWPKDQVCALSCQCRNSMFCEKCLLGWAAARPHIHGEEYIPPLRCYEILPISKDKVYDIKATCPACKQQVLPKYVINKKLKELKFPVGWEKFEPIYNQDIFATKCIKFEKERYDALEKSGTEFFDPYYYDFFSFTCKQKLVEDKLEPILGKPPYMKKRVKRALANGQLSFGITKKYWSYYKKMAKIEEQIEIQKKKQEEPAI